MGLGDKLFDEAGRILGFKITKVLPVEETTMEISFASEIIGTGRVPSGNNMGSGVIIPYPHGMVDGSYQGAFTTAEREQFLWWANEKGKIIQGGKVKGRNCIWTSMTINSLNYSSVQELTDEWLGKVNKIGFQFHTPFVKGDPLMLPFGERSNNIVDMIIEMKKKYPKFIDNPAKQLSLMKGNWGGIGTTPVQCPSWAILSLDHMGRTKQPCCIGSADSKGIKPICEECGLGCYSVLVAQGIRGA